MSFEKCIHICNPHHRRDAEQCLHPRKFLLAPLQHPFFLQPLATARQFPIPVALPFPECGIKMETEMFLLHSNLNLVLALKEEILKAEDV